VLLDARNVDRDVLDADLCIVGAGAAGIALAREFVDRPVKVCLLESGGLEADDQTQFLADGDSVGLYYGPLVAARLRQFGGTTNHWGAYCRPLKPWDLERRPGVPHSGWPIRFEDLAPHYPPALDVCGIPRNEFDVQHWRERSPYERFPLEGDLFEDTVSQVVPKKSRARFGKAYRRDLEMARNVDVLLRANLLEFEVDEYGTRVVRARIACLSGKRFAVEAQHFVLATGGIENARLLLLSRGHNPAGLGNEHDLVGRFFMEHPRFPSAIYQPSESGVPIDFYKTHEVDGAVIKAYLTLRDEVKTREELVDVQLRLVPVHDPAWTEALDSAGVRSAKRIARRLRDGRMPDDLDTHIPNVIGDLDDFWALAKMWAENGGGPPIHHVEVLTRMEQTPNPDSRVRLGDRQDALGQPRVQVDWRLDPLDVRSARRGVELFANEVGRNGLGRVKVLLSDDDAQPLAKLRGGWHHMGTTRMSDDATTGVVDSNCRVHSLANLYVAGSSVFPTAGTGTPTLTLVALALRLAAHLKERMSW
jgi:choline dehydrogenase-like flavoprotein